MSSMDQVFVKAFSRRRLAEPDRDARLAAPRHEETQKSEVVDLTGQPGSLEVNRSVAGTAEVWVDSVVDQIARPDPASMEIPKPHVDGPHHDSEPQAHTPIAFERPVDKRPGAGSMARHEELQTSRDPSDVHRAERTDLPTSNPVTTNTGSSNTGSTNTGPLQHIHTAYAGAFADPSLFGSSSSLDEDAAMGIPVTEPRPTPESNLLGSRLQSQPVNSRLQSQPVNRIANLPTVEKADSTRTLDQSTAVAPIEFSEPAEPEHEVEEDAVIDLRVDSPTPVQSIPPADSATTYVPFQAVWEVDVFDVPTPVADLFFEGALFQQIAERMSEAVGSGLRTVMVTSAKPGEGRSSVAIGMAMAAAAAGIRVALVDADTESPTLADELRLDLQYGWVDVIRRGLPIKEIAVQAVEDGVTLIPLMPPGVRPAATAFEMVQLVDLLTSNFELIILDGPTSLSPGLQQCASRVDSAVIVRDMSRTDELAVCELSNRLQDAGVRGVGVVENFV